MVASSTTTGCHTAGVRFPFYQFGHALGVRYLTRLLERHQCSSLEVSLHGIQLFYKAQQDLLLRYGSLSDRLRLCPKSDDWTLKAYPCNKRDTIRVKQGTPNAWKASHRPKKLGA
eukprot:6089857-Amphidinium_carterae.4